MSKIISALTFTFFALFSFQIHAQYQGKILDKETNKPINDTEIFIEDLNLTATTDQNGVFTLSNFKEGSYEAIIFNYGRWKKEKRRSKSWLR